MKKGINILLQNYINKYNKHAKQLLLETQTVYFDLSYMNFHHPMLKLPFFLNPDDEGLSVDLMHWKFREPLNTFLLQEFLEKHSFDVIIDVGSNIGYFPFLENVFGAKRIIAIEPVPESFKFLVKNVSRFSNISSLNYAITTKYKRKERIYMVIPEKRNQAKCVDTYTEGALEVKIQTLYDVIESMNVSNCSIMLRMDVEGYEELILFDLPKQINALSFEFHSNFIGYDRSIELLENLLNNGFTISVIGWDNCLIYFLSKNFGLKKALAIHNFFSKRNRLVYDPSREMVENFISSGESFHLYAIRHS